MGKLFVCVDDRVSDFSEFHHSQQHTRHHSDDTDTKQDLEKGTGSIPGDEKDSMTAEEGSYGCPDELRHTASAKRQHR